MTITRRQLLAAGGGTLGVGLLSACSAGGAGGGSTLQLWNKFSNTATQKYFQTNFVDAYNRSAKSRVALQAKPSGSFDQTVQTAVAAGHGPDIVVTNSPATATSYAKSGYLASLDSAASKDDWSTKLLPWAYGAGTVGGHLYSIPNSYETLIAYFNPATMQKYGWTAPTNKDDFEALCTDAKGRGLIPIGAGTASAPDVTQWFVTIFFNSFAGPDAVYSALEGKTRFNDPVFVDAITLMNSYFQKGWYGGSVQNYFTNTFEDLYAKLASGKVAMMHSGSWSFSELPPYFGSAANNSATWDWTALPSFSSAVQTPPYTLSVGGTFSVSKKSTNVEGALEYLNWLVSNPKKQLAALKDVGFEPIPIPITESEFPSGTDPRLSRLYTDLAQSKQVGYTMWTFLPPQTDTFAYTGMNKVLTGKLTPAAYCSQLADLFDKERKAGQVPAIPKPE